MTGDRSKLWGRVRTGNIYQLIFFACSVFLLSSIVAIFLVMPINAVARIFRNLPRVAVVASKT